MRKINCFISLVIFASVLFSHSRLEAFSVPVVSGPCSVPVVAITFDDGPHFAQTSELLDILEDLGVRATFFIVGVQAIRYPDLLARIVERGHGVANHSWSHRTMPLLDEEELFDEIAFCSQAIEAIAGIRPRFFRPPGGNWNESVINTASELGLSMVLWNVNAYDTTAKSAKEIAASVIRISGPGSIILLHGGMKKTMEALPSIVLGLRSKGLLFATLDQMFRFLPEAKVPIQTSRK